jgi:predicted GIY-YIG superfamily endonuclease
MFYTYILQSLSKPDEIYVGFTQDLKQRLEEHNTGMCPHTSKFSPWSIKAYLAFESRELALKFEKYLKTGSGHAFRHRHLGC